MNIYLELLLVTAVVVYIVGLSGWTDTWLNWLSKFTARYGYGPVRSLRPFSCSQCMTWWCCLAWCIIRSQLSVPTVAASAGFAFYSITLYEFFIFLRESILWLVGKMNGLWLRND